ncbi:MAG: dicarboxylate/amino acid:cation symporter, partial [Bacteroidia bacterium]|nr:dicarboxylate/amino acid:cation symporter [Bacteroidia bacterium]
YMGWQEGTRDWIKPFGTIFINLLKLIAVPLIVASLIKGITGMKNIAQLSRMGLKTLGLYIVSTVLAVTIGLTMVNTFQPGIGVSEDTRNDLITAYGGDADEKIEMAMEQKDAGPLQFFVDLVPDNIIGASSNNRNMLQVIFFVILFSIGIILIPPSQAEPLVKFFDGFNEVILKIIDIIMLTAPYGVFALMAALIVDAPSADIFIALGKYAITLVIGLFLMIVIYFVVVGLVIKKNPKEFFNGISPAQLVAFSTSSSAATLPVTMERVEEHLGVDQEVSSFVLPIGATVNMDGTSLYQGVAAVFIAQVFGVDLSLMDQLTIILTATLASIGSAAVPSAGIIMLVIVLEAISVPAAGIALIFAPDRPLDMLRTVVNVTGDATVSMLVAKSEDKLGTPLSREWDDYYEPEADE